MRAPATSRRTTSHLFPKAPGSGGVETTSNGRPIPPVNHRPRFEVAPEVGLSCKQQTRIPGDLETQQWRCIIEREEVDGSTDGALESHGKRWQLAGVNAQDSDVHVAGGSGRPTSSGPE